jgi:hypothetical protein
MSDEKRGLDEKLAEHDAFAKPAVQWIIDWLREAPDEALSVARARHVTGHYVHGDRLMFEFDDGRLQKEALEELADAVCYLSLMLSRRAEG